LLSFQSCKSMQQVYSFVKEVLADQNEGYLSAGEFSSYLVGIKSGSYRAGFNEAFNDFHDCQPRRRTLRSGKGKISDFNVQKPYLNILSTIVDEVLYEAVTITTAKGGFLPRWLMVYGKGNPRARGRLSPKSLELNKMLSEMLRQLVSLEKDAKFVLSDEALKFLDCKVSEFHEKYANVDAFIERYANYWIAFADLQNLAELISYAMDSGKWSSITSLSQLNNVVPVVPVNSISKLGTESVLTPTNNINNITCTKGTIECETNEDLERQRKELEEQWKCPLLLTQVHHLQLALPIIENALKTASEMMRYLELNKVVAIVRKYLIKNHLPGDKVYHSVLMRMTNRTSGEMSNIVYPTLKERGEINGAPRPTGTKGGVAFTWLGPKEDKSVDTSPMILPDHKPILTEEEIAKLKAEGKWRDLEHE